MPFCEADPWRLQYFEGVASPPDLRIPTEDPDAYQWNPAHRWVYNKLSVAESQGLECGPHGVEPPHFPVFSKPIMNLHGMGVGSRVLRDRADYQRHETPGHFWMTLLEGEHVSTDVVVERGRTPWFRHCLGVPAAGGTFDYWTIEAGRRPELEQYLGEWAARHLASYTGMLNAESIGGRVIETHLRVADQWPIFTRRAGSRRWSGCTSTVPGGRRRASGAPATVWRSLGRTAANTGIRRHGSSPRCATCRR